MNISQKKQSISLEVKGEHAKLFISHPYFTERVRGFIAELYEENKAASNAELDDWLEDWAEQEAYSSYSEALESRFLECYPNAAKYNRPDMLIPYSEAEEHWEYERQVKLAFIEKGAGAWEWIEYCQQWITDIYTFCNLEYAKEKYQLFQELGLPCPPLELLERAKDSAHPLGES